MTTPLLTPGQLKEMRVRIGVRQCAWCQTFLDEDDKPTEAPEDNSPALISHTICLPCIKKLKSKYDTSIL